MKLFLSSFNDDDDDENNDDDDVDAEVALMKRSEKLDLVRN